MYLEFIIGFIVTFKKHNGRFGILELMNRRFLAEVHTQLFNQGNILKYLNFIKDWNKARNDVILNLVESRKLEFQIWACPWFSVVLSNLRFL